MITFGQYQCAYCPRSFIFLNIWRPPISSLLPDPSLFRSAGHGDDRGGLVDLDRDDVARTARVPGRIRHRPRSRADRAALLRRRRTALTPPDRLLPSAVFTFKEQNNSATYHSERVRDCLST